MTTFLKESELETERVLEKAITAIGNIPGSFSLTIFNLMVDLNSGKRPNEGLSKFQVQRMLSVPTVYNCILEACHSYEIPWEDNHDHGFPDIESITLGAMFSSVYLYRRLKKIADPAEWAFILPYIHRDVMISGILAKTLCKQGLGIGLLGTMASYAGIGTLSLLDKKAFKDYRRRRKSEGFFTDSKLEAEIFGCSAIMIGTAIIQRFRFGPELAESYMNGFDLSIPQSLLSNTSKQYRLIANVLKSLYLPQKNLEIFESKALNLEPGIITQIKNLIQQEQTSCWLSVGISQN